MEEYIPEHEKPGKGAHKTKAEVYVLRDWKEYLGESFLIIFSVLLALGLSEFLSKRHDKLETRELLDNIKEELVKNKSAEVSQYNYQKMVMKNIDSALDSRAFQQKLVMNDRFYLLYLAPSGATYRDLSNVAWEIAKSHNIITRASFKLVSKLTIIYDDQDKIARLDDKVGELLLSPASRNPANVHLTLALLKDNYRAWAFDRAPALIARYDEAIKMIDAEE